SFLPAGFTVSEAFGINNNGVVLGAAAGSSGWVPVIWQPVGTQFLTITQSPHTTNKGWSTSSGSLYLSSPYATSTAVIVYSVIGGITEQSSGSALTIPLTADGAYRLQAYAADGLGHRTPTQAYIINIDTSPPVTTYIYANSVLTLKAKDATSGVAATYYVVDGGATLRYGAPVTLTNIQHTLQYWSVDGAGNIESQNSATLAAAAPSIKSLSPNAALSGGNSFVLIITGKGFISSSVAQWNGSARTTYYVSPTEVYIAVSSSDIATPGVYQVSVTNPAPGTGTTASLPFTVKQTAIATGSAANIQDVSDTSFDLSPVASHSGFTLQGSLVHCNTTAATTFMDKYGNGMSSSVFFDTVATGQPLKVTGTYNAANNTITAYIVQEQ
ncbi:MAG TPA: IPT/TIG domain-containing protein, partial [Chthonomonadales bacterium]|nr:IPT/TIG domain-containing protein [Chthonomonadales bacterium]